MSKNAITLRTSVQDVAHLTSFFQSIQFELIDEKQVNIIFKCTDSGQFNNFVNKNSYISSINFNYQALEASIPLTETEDSVIKQIEKLFATLECDNKTFGELLVDIYDDICSIENEFFVNIVKSFLLKIKTLRINTEVESKEDKPKLGSILHVNVMYHPPISEVTTAVIRLEKEEKKEDIELPLSQNPYTKVYERNYSDEQFAKTLESFVNNSSSEDQQTLTAPIVKR